jgi:hypothetical protein
VATPGRAASSSSRKRKFHWPAKRPLDEIAIEGPGKQEGNTFEVTVGPEEPERVAIDLGAAEKDRPGTVRLVDLVERDGEGAIVGGTTFVTVAAPGTAAERIA